jgi:hypothetical protein
LTHKGQPFAERPELRFTPTIVFEHRTLGSLCALQRVIFCSSSPCFFRWLCAGLDA